MRDEESLGEKDSEQKVKPEEQSSEELKVDNQ